MTAPPPRRSRTPRALAVLLLVLGGWGVVAPDLSRAVGLPVPVPPRVEVVDHVLPGIAVLAVAAITLVLGRLPLVSALIATLAGFWMTATHVPLLLDALGGLASLPAALIHSLPGILVLAVSTVAAVRAWTAEAQGVPPS